MNLATGSPRASAAHFDRLYAADPDPWSYCTSSYEHDKYARTLSALPSRPLQCALEVGCSIGVFTEQLAERCEHVVGIDFSARALERARERLNGVANVTLTEASFPEQTPPGPWDAIVCSEVLYYLDLAALSRATLWLADQLRAGACAIAVSWRGVGSEEPLHGDCVHDLLAHELRPWHVSDDRSEGYRLDRFDGNDR